LRWLRLGIAFELIEWPAGEALRDLNDGVSSLCGLVGALLPDYLYSAPLGFNHRQSLEDYFANRESIAFFGVGCLTNWARAKEEADSCGNYDQKGNGKGKGKGNDKGKGQSGFFAVLGDTDSRLDGLGGLWMHLVFVQLRWGGRTKERQPPRGGDGCRLA